MARVSRLKHPGAGVLGVKAFDLASQQTGNLLSSFPALRQNVLLSLGGIAPARRAGARAFLQMDRLPRQGNAQATGSA